MIFISFRFQFLSWENISFSVHLLYQLIWLIFYGYVSELRPYFDLFADIVMLQDSWQEHRVLYALSGESRGNLIYGMRAFRLATLFFLPAC